MSFAGPLTPLEPFRVFDGAIRQTTLDQQIAALFANNEQGVWYDIDPAYCYQDAAGTTPAVVGQPVGLVLDRSGRGNHASQTTATSRPILRQNATTGAHYLEFDGSDDWLVTGSIDFTATDKMTVWAGVRKSSDAAQAVVFELGALPGTVMFRAPASAAPNYTLSSGGTVAVGAVASPFAAPITSVISGSTSISANLCSIAINGTPSGQNTGTQGTGNYGNYPLYIGRRAGTPFPFNGHLYGLTIRGAQSTEAQIKLVERYLAKKTGVTLA